MIEAFLKIFLGFIVISFVHLVTVQLFYGSFLMGFINGIVFWIVVLIFMDWRDWVKYDIKDKKSKGENGF